MLLQPQLEECRRALQADAAPQLHEAIRKWRAGLEATGILAGAVKAGDAAPVFRLPDRRGRVVTLSSLLRTGPAVISFFWCDQCPLCRLELEALAKAHPEIEQQGATLVGISPEMCDGSPPLGARPELPFPLLKDVGCEAAKRYGLAFRIPPDVQPAYAALGCPLKAPDDRPDAWLLPIPATYIVDATRRVVLSYLDPDDTTRLEPVEIIVALTRLRQQGEPSPIPTKQISKDKWVTRAWDFPGP